MQYMVFIKNPPAKNALQKSFLPCNIKIKNMLKISEAATKGSSPKVAIHKINNKRSKILEKHP